jgi:hypothetical protein
MGAATITHEAYIPLANLGGGKLVAHVGEGELSATDTVSDTFATKLTELFMGRAQQRASGTQTCAITGFSAGDVTIEKAVLDTEQTFDFLLIGRVL